MPSGSPLPSPMAFVRSSTSSKSLFRKKSAQSLPSSAASLLSAVSQADAQARAAGRPASTTSTVPALTMSSGASFSSAGTAMDVDDNEDGLAYPIRSPPTSEQVFTTAHTEFGHCANEEYRTASAHDESVHGVPEMDPPYFILMTTYISYLLLIVLGHVRDFFGKRFYPKSYEHLVPVNGYAPLTSDFDSFYTRRLKTRLLECFTQPVTGVAGRTIKFIDRYSTDWNETMIHPGTTTRTLNISSYNYLGFAQSLGGCADAVEESLRRYGIASCGTRMEGGSSELHNQAEALVARFVGMEDSVLSSMGFATNSGLIPALVGKGCLVISDELNHASIRFGVRISGAHVRMFKHNDMNALEKLLREVISQGHPKTHRPWKKILVIVEGLYSMEGDMVKLPTLIELKKRYKFNLFVDEAHSVGALGPHGRGVCDYFNINPREVDILMGTFTKSFGAAGGYIAANKPIIDSIRQHGHLGTYAESVAPPVLMQVIASMASIMGVAPPVHSPSPSRSTVAKIPQDDGYQHPGPISPAILPSWLSLPPALASGVEGQDRIRRLAFNSRYLTVGLHLLGFITYGHPFSPVVPLLLFHPGKMLLFHRMMLSRKTPICTVVVAYPATDLVTSRVRFCVSAAHTKEDIDTVLVACDEIGDWLSLKQGIPKSERLPVKEIMERATELVNEYRFDEH
ncbi:PLP-dependent transferase [Schizophyllum commune Loenen D]|nr:PLP-dependent transferase [Schizophyllum commune Loenen D]